MANIKLHYLYRDVGNYKTYGYIVFRNPGKASLENIEGAFKAKLIDGQFFNPADWNLPRIVHSNQIYNPELDHLWNEFDYLEETHDPPNDIRTINDFLLSLI